MIDKDEFVFGNRSELIEARDRLRRLRAMEPRPYPQAERDLRGLLITVRAEEERLRKTRRG